jgi:hypothetical protein
LITLAVYLLGRALRPGGWLSGVGSGGTRLRAEAKNERTAAVRMITVHGLRNSAGPTVEVPGERLYDHV